MKIRFLGTNGWYSTNLGNTSCIMVDSKKHYIVFDAGDGIYKLNKYISSNKPVHLFLSHMHLDHIIGLHTLGKIQNVKKLMIYGQRNTAKYLEIIRHPYTAPFASLPFKTTITELDEGKYVNPFKMMCKFLTHSDPCLGYRVKVENKILAYCTDTGPCDNLYTLAENADLLILECSFQPRQTSSLWPHLNPEQASTIASKSKVKRLVLTHFDAHSYKTMKDRLQAEITAKKNFRDTVAAYDGLEIEL